MIFFLLIDLIKDIERNYYKKKEKKKEKEAMELKECAEGYVGSL